MNTEIREAVDQFVQRLQTSAGAALECVALYGSAARNEFNQHYSDVNLLLVLRNASRSVLDAIAPVLAWWTRDEHHRPPLVVTEEELRTSADTFAIETLDLTRNYRILAGRDVVSTLQVPMNLHRVQVEHELRSLLLKLRQHYLVAHGNERQLETVIAKSASSTLTLFRHALIALGRPEPSSRRDVVAAVTTLEGIDAAPLQAALDLREARRVEAGTDTLYLRYMESIAALIRVVDNERPQ